LRSDLLGLVRAARTRGFTDVKVQSNGLVYAQARNVEALLSAGVSRFHVSIHTHEAAAYEALVRRAGTFALLEAGLANLVAQGVTLVADLILKRDTIARLPAAIAWLEARGVRAAHLWFVSLTDGNRDQLASLPKMTEAMPFVHEALAFARVRGLDVRSLHIPRCLLGEDAAHAYDPGADRVRVVTPDARFELRDSRLAGQVHVAACEGCDHRALCPGVRPDYLEVYGDAEIAAARGQPPRLSPTRHLTISS
jgi:hypothetical protein